MYRRSHWLHLWSLFTLSEDLLGGTKSTITWHPWHFPPLKIGPKWKVIVIVVRALQKSRVLSVVLLLIAPVQFPQLLLPNSPSFVGFGGAAGASRLGRLGAVAARRRPLEEVLRYATLQVLHGGGRGHANDPRVLQGLSGCKPLAGVHRQDPLNKILGQVGHAGPWLHRDETVNKWAAAQQTSRYT